MLGGLGNFTDRQRVDRRHRLAAALGNLIGFCLFTAMAIFAFMRFFGAHWVLLEEPEYTLSPVQGMTKTS
jgi:hypothetical protein